MASTLPQFNVRLDPPTIELINRLATHLAVSQAVVVKLAARALARREGIDQRKTRPTDR